MPLKRNVLKPLAKSVLIPLVLTAATIATDAAFLKKMFWSGFTTLIISNEEINYIMKIMKSFEESGLLINSVSKTVKNVVKEQKGGFLSTLLGTLCVSWLGNLLAGNGTIRVREDTIRKG